MKDSSKGACFLMPGREIQRSLLMEMEGTERPQLRVLLLEWQRSHGVPGHEGAGPTRFSNCLQVYEVLSKGQGKVQVRSES